jgi:hypothetical protein
MTFITFLFMQYVSIQNFCLNYFNRFMKNLKDRMRVFAGPPEQDYWLLSDESNKGRVFPVLYTISNELSNNAFQFISETNRIRKSNTVNDRFVRLPYISFEYHCGEQSLDLSDWIQTLRISENHTIDPKTLCALWSSLNYRILNFHNARINVITRQGASMEYHLS